MMGVIEQIASIPPARAALIAGRLLHLHSPSEIAQAVEIMLDVLDLLEPTEDEPDFRPRSDGQPGDPGDHEPAGDGDDAAWVEWGTMRGNQRSGPNPIAGHEDDEAGGDEQDGDFAEDEPCRAFGTMKDGPGCSVADEDMAVDDQACDDDTDTEVEQMPNDVPMLRVLSADYNIFTDQRVLLGISNLQSSFRGDGVRSADTGKVHRSPRRDDDRPGSPV